MTSSMPRNRLQLYCDDDVYELLKLLADKETRSVPNVAEALIVEALRSRGLKSNPPNIDIKKD